MGFCTSLDDVAKPGRAAPHDGLVHAVVRVLERASLRHCRRGIVEYVLRLMIERQLKERKHYIRLGNLVVEVAEDSFEARRLRLFQHMRGLASAAPWLDAIYGVITDGVHAEYYVLGMGGSPELKMRGSLGEVATTALASLCADKVPIVSPEDVAAIFGI